MKVTIWGINYDPEPTGIGPFNTDLCAFLAERGHEVRMLTGFPYYPSWKKARKDRGRLYRRDRRAAVSVFRCWQYVPARPNAFRRILHEGSFIATSFLRLLFLPRPDLLLVVSPPLLLGPAAWLAGWFKRCPFHFHVQDMQPDAALALGLLKPGLLSGILQRFERIACNKARTVSAITQGMVEAIRAKGTPQEKLLLLPNWLLGKRGQSANGPTPGPGAFRRAHEIADDAFLVIYSGNLGKKQGLDIILDAAKTCAAFQGHAPEVVFIIAGEGAARDDLECRIRNESIPVRLLPLQPEPMFHAMLADADLCLITQQKRSGTLFFPSKLLSLLSASCAVLAVADRDSELARAAAEGDFAVCTPPDDPGALAAAILELAGNQQALSKISAAGAAWVRRFSRESVLGTFARQLETSVGAGAPSLRARALHEQQ